MTTRLWDLEARRVGDKRDVVKNAWEAKGVGAGTERSCPVAGAHRGTLVIGLFFHLHETEHVIIDKMAMDSTDHEIGPRIGEQHHFNTVL
jgi:hypothetical protein